MFLIEWCLTIALLIRKNNLVDWGRRLLEPWIFGKTIMNFQILLRKNGLHIPRMGIQFGN